MRILLLYICNNLLENLIDNNLTDKIREIIINLR